MELDVGLDVSLKQSAIGVVDRGGKIVIEAMVASDPAALAAFVKAMTPGAVWIGLETGPTATWLCTELTQFGQPVICIDARALLKMQINKSDRNDAFPRASLEEVAATSGRAGAVASLVQHFMARQMIRQKLACGLRLSRVLSCRRDRRRGLGRGRFHVFQRQFQLRDGALDLSEEAPKRAPPQHRQLRLQLLDQRVAV
jgi:transposase